MNLRQTVFGLVFNLSPTHYHTVYDLYCGQTSGGQRRHFGFTFGELLGRPWIFYSHRSWCVRPWNCQMMSFVFYRDCQLILFGITYKSIQINLFQHLVSVRWVCAVWTPKESFPWGGCEMAHPRKTGLSVARVVLFVSGSHLSLTSISKPKHLHADDCLCHKKQNPDCLFIICLPSLF